MKLTEQVKILDDKMKANQAQYDLGYKPDVIQKTKFEYFP